MLREDTTKLSPVSCSSRTDTRGGIAPQLVSEKGIIYSQAHVKLVLEVDHAMDVHGLEGSRR